jgi:8-oxo-dGTP pyrophosphatase MutT (NUDIX family)
VQPLCALYPVLDSTPKPFYNEPEDDTRARWGPFGFPFFERAMSPSLEETIRQRLARRKRSTIEEPHLRHSAVLVPLFEADGEARLVFTKRSDTVEHHKGQVSFPGGGRDDDDASLLETALRETEEEIGLRASDVRPLGALDDKVTTTNFVVTPFVGLIPYPYDFTICDFEIHEIFSVPVEYLIAKENFHIVEAIRPGKPQPQYLFRAHTHVIWGTTARILHQFLDLCFKTPGSS